MPDAATLVPLTLGLKMTVSPCGVRSWTNSGASLFGIERRSRSPEEHEPHHPVRTLSILPTWPKRMPWSSAMTFKQWFVAEENLNATQCCERVVDRPGSGLNPLMLSAEQQAGCSHFSTQRDKPCSAGEGHVLWLTAADASTVDGLEAQWQDALVGAVAVVVDDVDAFAYHEVWRHQLGLLLDHGLNLGVQVASAVIGPLTNFHRLVSRTCFAPRAWPTSAHLVRPR